MNNLQEEQEAMRLRIASREPCIKPRRSRARRSSRVRKERSTPYPVHVTPEVLTNNEQNVLHVLESLDVTRIYRSGWPDFAVEYNSKQHKKKLTFVEVKSGANDFPTGVQEAMHDLLRSFGFSVIVIDGESRPELIRYRLEHHL